MGKKPGGKKSKEYWVGFDLGGTKMLSIVFDDEFNKLGKARKKTKGYEGMEAGLKRINNTIEESLEDAGIENRKFEGWGLDVPGHWISKRE